MKRKKLIVILGLSTVLSLTACGSSSSGTDSGSDADTAVTEAAEETDAEAEETDAEAEATDEAEETEEAVYDEEEDTEEAEEDESEDALASITPSDYLVENASDYITVGDLEGLEATQYAYEITDETVQEEIDAELEMMSEENEVDRAAESGDLIYVELTSTVEGSDDSYSENTYFYLGDEEYGEEFDENLIGASSGDTLSFTITFSSDAADETMIDEEWAGQTVDFEVEVESVCELTLPEYNDDYVAENTDYSTTEEYEEALREYLEEEYEDFSYVDVLDALLESALADSEISEIPEELYDACYEETINSYATFLDTSDEEEILAEFDMTEEDLELEVQELAERRLLISYICEEYNIEITEDDYVSYVESYAEYYGYDSAADFEEDLDRSYLVWTLYESAAAEILYENADITTETYDEDAWLSDEEIEYIEEEESESE